MANYLNIPKDILVGINGQQGFVTYKTGSKIAKEFSWKNWTGDGEKKDFENTPITGFKLKDCIGGKGGSWYSFTRRAWAIIEDPRGFDIEITFDNLIWIMKYYSHNVNCGFQGELVYGWDGVQMLLVPTVTDDYEYTKKIDDVERQYKLKECIVGETYKYPNDKPMIYLGYLPIIICKGSGEYEDVKREYSVKKYHCFKRRQTETWNLYEIVSSTKKPLIKVNKHKQLSNNEIDEAIRKLYKHKFNNETFEAPNIVKFIPPVDNKNRIENLLKWIDAPYKARLTNYDYWTDNCEIGVCHMQFGIILFNEDKTEITQYFIGAEASVNGLDRNRYVEKCIKEESKRTGEYYYDNIKEKRNKYNKEFNELAKRFIYVSPAYSYVLKENNIIQKITFNDKTRTSARQFIEINKDNIYIQPSYLDNFEKSVKLVNESGFEFIV